MAALKTTSVKKSIKDLELKKAYAEYKIRAGDLDPEFDNWVSNIIVAIGKVKKK